MKNFMKKISLFAMFGLIMSSVIFGEPNRHDRQTVDIEVTFPTKEYKIFEAKEDCHHGYNKCSFGDGHDPVLIKRTSSLVNTYQIPGKTTNYKYFVQKNGSTLKNSVKYASNFKNKSKWIFTTDGVHEWNQLT